MPTLWPSPRVLIQIGEQIIYRYYIFQDGFHWDYWKCRIQLKAMARVYSLHLDQLLPLYKVEPDVRANVEAGRLIPRNILEGPYDLNRSLEDYAYTEDECSGAPEQHEMPKVLEYIREKKLEELARKLQQTWNV